MASQRASYKEAEPMPPHSPKVGGNEGQNADGDGQPDNGEERPDDNDDDHTSNAGGSSDYRKDKSSDDEGNDSDAETIITDDGIDNEPEDNAERDTQAFQQLQNSTRQTRMTQELWDDMCRIFERDGTETTSLIRLKIWKRGLLPHQAL